MDLDPFKVVLSKPAADCLASSKPDDFDRLLDLVTMFAGPDGGLGESCTCVGVRDFVIGVRRRPGFLEVHWIDDLRSRGLPSASNDTPPPSQESESFAS